MGQYHRTVEQVQGGLHIKERFTLEPRRVPIERYATLRAFADKVLAPTPYGTGNLNADTIAVHQCLQANSLQDRATG